ncbi:MAG: hypothetical protein JWO36_7082, partial [Myxococcales bacterium]|nr:hypothetical protein [Myxococcales bacterium]
GTTVNALSNYDSGLETATCTGLSQPGGDVAYSVVLAASTAYTFTLTGVDPNLDPSISLVGPGAAAVCDVDPVNCLAGADAGALGENETLHVTTTAAGTYYVIVDSFDTATSGTFTVKVTSP